MTLFSYFPQKGPLLYYTGPDLSLGPLPALFYFSLSAEASLSTDPYNQLVTFCGPSDLRIFSCTLPYHTDKPESFETAINFWAQEFKMGQDIISTFVDDLNCGIESLIQEGFIDPTKIAVAGLSRGAFIATHLAARNSKIEKILGFAPLTKLSAIEEFKDIESTLHHSLDLSSISSKLIGKHLRFYIGNRDTRVSTHACFEFIQELTEANYQNNNRSPQVELIISSSCGRYGHGTLPHIFRDGALWLNKELALERN